MQANRTTQVADVRDQEWYARSADEVARTRRPRRRIAGGDRGRRLRANRPNALPEEKPKPGWQRFLDEYRSYMQIILIAAAAVSAAVGEWGTAVLLVVLTVLNAVMGLRQQGKAESAMNTLKSLMKATAKVCRDGVVREVPAEDLTVGDVVLIAAADQVPADGRLVEAVALQIDESGPSPRPQCDRARAGPGWWGERLAAVR